MKRLKKIFLSVALLSPTLSYAYDLPWLTFTMKDDSHISVVAENLTINYSDNALRLKSATVDRIIPVAEINSMEFTSSPSAVKDLMAEPGTPMEYYTLAGVKAGSFLSVEEARAALPSGVYLLRNGERSCKVIF